MVAVLIVLAWTLLGIGLRFWREPNPATAAGVWSTVLFTAAFWLTLLALLRTADLAWLWSIPMGWRDALRNGVDAFAASLFPTWLLLVATKPLRRADVEHSLLQLWQAEPTATVILGIIVAAVVLAPLLEELQYRVILQPWATSILGRTLGIAAVALLFSLLHGWRDGVALIPLALILGWAYQRTQSYLTVVTAHALFNALNLILAAASGWSGR